MSGKLQDLGDGIKEGELYVPLYAEKKVQQQKLRDLLKYGHLKAIPQDVITFPESPIGYGRRSQDEQKYTKYYQYDNDIYLALYVHSSYNDGPFHYGPIPFNNGEVYHNGDRIFIKVKKTTLYVDEKRRKAFFVPILFAGVPISQTEEYPEYFEDSDMGLYLKDYLKNLLELQQVVKGKSLRLEFHRLRQQADLLDEEIQEAKEVLQSKQKKQQRINERMEQVKEQLAKGAR